MVLGATHGWESRQVDYSNAFCQAWLPPGEELFIELPAHYKPKGYEHMDVVLRLKKSLYGTVTVPKLFYEHLCKGLAAC